MFCRCAISDRANDFPNATKAIASKHEGQLYELQAVIESLLGTVLTQGRSDGSIEADARPFEFIEIVCFLVNATIFFSICMA